MTASTVLLVSLGDVEIGDLRRAGNRDSPISFTYDDAYRSRANATPLSCSMPLTAAHHRAKVIEPFLWGLLPDDGDVLDRWARDAETTRRDLLGIVANVGRDLPGAVGVAAADADPEPDGVEWIEVDEVAEMIRAVCADSTAWHPDHRWRWSLAGAHSKLALLEEGGRWGRPTSRLASNTILKPAITGLDGHDLNEHLCLAAARGLGMRAARSRIVRFGPERVVAVERYDRPNIDGAVQRLHQEDLCQALGVDPSRKYESDGGPSAEMIATLLHERVGVDAAHDAVSRFSDALVYSWLIAAPDQHAKNYSVLLSGAQVRLAPLYDVASALPYDDYRDDSVKLASRIGGRSRIDMIRPAAWRRQADSMHLDPSTLIERADELAERLPDAFADAVNALDRDLRPGLPTRLVNEVSARAGRCRRVLDAAA